MNHIASEDLALYALQLLSAEDAATMRQHLATCAECRRELAAVEGDLAIFAMTVEMHAPQASSRDRLLSAVAREPRAQATRTAVAEAPPVPTAQSNVGNLPPTDVIPITFGRRATDFAEPERRPARVLPWVGWAVAAGLAFLSVHLYRERQDLRNQVATTAQQNTDLELQAANSRRVQETLTDSSAVRVNLTSPKAAPEPQGKATYVPGKGALIFIASNLKPLQPYKTYELWIIPASGQAPVAAGLFRPDSLGNASVILPDVPVGVQAKAFGVTVEDEGGAKSPTMPILLSGAAAGV